MNVFSAARGRSSGATFHGAINSNGQDLNAHLLLALAERDLGNQEAALQELATVEKIDPSGSCGASGKVLLDRRHALLKKTLIDLMGAQSESAIEVSIFYSSLARWKEAAAILKMVEPPQIERSVGNAASLLLHTCV